MRCSGRPILPLLLLACGVAFAQGNDEKKQPPPDPFAASGAKPGDWENGCYPGAGARYSDVVEVDGARLPFHRAVIATGGRAAVPAIPGLDCVPHLNNESLFALTELPARLLVIGAGPIGCEMAQAFRRFGSDVTLVDRADQLLSKEDADAAREIRR